MAHHSSSLGVYRTCPRRYRLLRENPALATATVAMERGTAVHRGAETMVRVLADGGDRRDAEARARAAVEDMRGELSGEALEETRWFLDRLTRQPFPEKLPSEVWLAEWPFAFDKDWNLLPMPERGLPEGSYYYGRVDFLRFDLDTGYIAVRDWKSSRQLESPKTLAGGFQLPGYIEAAMAEVERRGGSVQVADIERHYTSKGVLQSYRLSDEDLNGRFRSRIDAEIATIEKDRDFNPTPEAAKCMDCPVRFLCDAYLASGQKAVEPKTQEEALALYREKELAEARAETAATFLKAWVKRHGPIPIGGGKALDFKDYEKREVRDDAVDLLIDTRGFDAKSILEVTNLTVTGLERLLGDDPADLAPFVVKKMESRLGKVDA